MGDFKVTVARTGEACKWRHGVAEEWYAKGEEVAGTCWRRRERLWGRLKQEKQPRHRGWQFWGSIIAVYFFAVYLIALYIYFLAI
jgi:hypothetical protein